MLAPWPAAGTDVYVYFNNDAHGWAVANAASLLALLPGTGAPTERPVQARTTQTRAPQSKDPRTNHHSHSMVPGGFEVMS